MVRIFWGKKNSVEGKLECSLPVVYFLNLVSACRQQHVKKDRPLVEECVTKK